MIKAFVVEISAFDLSINCKISLRPSSYEVNCETTKTLIKNPPLAIDGTFIRYVKPFSKILYLLSFGT